MTNGSIDRPPDRPRPPVSAPIGCRSTTTSPKAQSACIGFALAVCLSILAGCATPPASAPALPPSAQPPLVWTTRASTSSPVAWLDDFDDPALRGFVQSAVAQSPDLAAVAARFRQARARTTIAGAERFPSIDAAGNVSRRQSAGESRAGAFSPGRRDNFDVELSAAWEIDVWGRWRNAHRAARLEAAAAEADVAAARLSLAANVAKAWLNVIESQRQVELAERTQRTFEDALASIERKFDRGLQGEGAGLDVTLSRANVAASRANAEARRRELDAATRTLETLCGGYPAGKIRPRSQLPRLRRPVPAGLPSELLLRRPDIVAAERRHAATLQRLSGARKALLPSLRLTGSTGYTSSVLHDLLNPNQLVWDLAGGLSQSVFEGGRRLGAIELTKAERDEIAADYAQTALEAFREVESALAAERYLIAQLTGLEQAVETSRSAEKLALDRYDKGQVEIITVLEAQRRAFESEASLIRAQNDRLQNRIDLHLALGGDFSR